MGDTTVASQTHYPIQEIYGEKQQSRKINLRE